MTRSKSSKVRNRFDMRLPDGLVLVTLCPMSLHSLLTTLLLLALAFPFHSLQADDWHPEDETFDPSIESVIVQGSTRLGDPTPFHKDGLGVQSYTVVDAKPDQNLGALIHFALIVPFVPGQTSPQEGGALFLSVDQTQKLVGYLKEALEKPDKSRDVGKVFDDGYYQQYTVVVDAKNASAPVVLRHEMNEEVDQFRFAINPTKKLIDTLEHFIKEGQKIASGG